MAYFNNRSLLTLFRREDKPAYSDQTLEKLHHRYKQWGYCLSQTTDKDIFPRTWEECLKWQNKPNNLVVECVMRVCVCMCVLNMVVVIVTTGNMGSLLYIFLYKTLTKPKR